MTDEGQYEAHHCLPAGPIMRIPPCLHALSRLRSKARFKTLTIHPKPVFFNTLVVRPVGS